MNVDETSIGLRERKKLRTRRELADAALRLFAERGYHSVTVDDIADAVEVSPRTFFRYFPAKEDVLFPGEPEMVAALRNAIIGRPASEPVLDAVTNALLEMADLFVDDPELILQRARIVAETPSLQSRSLEQEAKWETAVADMVAERLGIDSTQDMTPRLVAGSTVLALRVAFERWADQGGSGDLPGMVIEAMDLLRRTLGDRGDAARVDPQ